MLICKNIQGKNINNEYIQEFFRTTPQEAEELFSKLRRIEYANAESIVKAGEEADAMYFIDDGKVDVINDEGNMVNEMGAGQYFGEYGVIAEEVRLTSCVARGKVVVYKMNGEDLLGEISRKPTIVGYLLKQVYSQLSVKYSKLLEMARAKRGIVQPERKRSKGESVTLAVTYAAIVLFFALVGVLTPPAEELGAFWIFVPVVFFLAHNILTRRTLETLILSVALTCGMANGGNYLLGFTDAIVKGITTPDTAGTILIMSLMGAVTALLDAAGGISAFKRPAEKGVKTASGALWAMFGILAMVFIDDCLNLLAAAFCIVGVSDRFRIPREVPALIGTAASAVCSVIPLSVWGAYLSGTMILSVGEKGGSVFLHTIKYNFPSWLAILMVVLICLRLLPKTDIQKQAVKRVEEGGELWPKGSEKYFLAHDDHEIYGSVHDLAIPISVMVIASVASGVIRGRGSFALDASTGLVITLVVMFALYCGEKLMTPEKFFDCVVSGVQSSILPILLLLLTVCFSNSLQLINISKFFEEEIPKITGSAVWLLPAVIFLVFAGLTMLIGSSWGMYGIGIPIAVQLAAVMSVNLPLCLGAVCGAGICGDNLIPYLSEGSLLTSAVGCEPHIVRRQRLQYWGIIGAVSLIFYAIAGLLA